MRRLVDFGINESSTMERLDSAHSKMDLVNGTGEYLGMIHLNHRKVMITRTISSGRNQYNGQIMANEVEYDVYSDGSISVYYNCEKSRELLRLQEQLNHPMIVEKLNEKNSLYDVMEMFGINKDRYGGYGKDMIERNFHPSTEYIYPDDYNYEEYARLGSSYSKEKEVKKIPAEKMIVTGIKSELFENLKQAREYMHMTTYQVAALLKQMEEEKSK